MGGSELLLTRCPSARVDGAGSLLTQETQALPMCSAEAGGGVGWGGGLVLGADDYNIE